MRSEHKAIFLDRDGVINRERGDYTWKEEDFILNEGLAPALLRFQQAGYLLIVITNQGGIGKGLYRFEDTERLHAGLRQELERSGVTLHEIYYCPHHPQSSNCICRKPDSLLIEKAIARFHIQASASWFIGDTDRDMVAAEKAGVKGVKIIANSTLEAVADKILH